MKGDTPAVALPSRHLELHSNKYAQDVRTLLAELGELE